MARPMSKAMSFFTFALLILCIVGIVMASKLTKGPYKIYGSSSIYQTPDIHSIGKASLAAGIIGLIMQSIGISAVWKDAESQIIGADIVIGINAALMFAMGACNAAIVGEINNIIYWDDGKCWGRDEVGGKAYRVVCETTRDPAGGACACFFIGCAFSIVWAVLGCIKTCECCDCPCCCKDDDRLGARNPARAPAALQAAAQRGAAAAQADLRAQQAFNQAVSRPFEQGGAPPPQFNNPPPGYGGGGGAPPPNQYGEAPPPHMQKPQYGAPPPQQYGAPPPQQYGAPPPQQYGAPQYGAPPPQQYAGPQYGGGGVPPPVPVPVPVPVDATQYGGGGANQYQASAPPPPEYVPPVAHEGQPGTAPPVAELPPSYSSSNVYS